MKNTFSNILVIRTDRIGDVVLTLPALHALRESFPAAKITALVSPLTQKLVCHLPDVNEVLVDDREGRHKGLFGFWRLVNELRQRRFDLAINFHTKKRTNALAFCAGISKRLGYKDKKWGGLLNHPVEDHRFKGQKHESEYCLDLLKEIGIADIKRHFNIVVDPEDQAWCETILGKYHIDKNKPLVAIHAGASDPSKCWPVKYFAQLITLINEAKPAHFVLVGTGALTSTAQIIRESSKADILDLTGKSTVGQLAALLKRADLLISNDSGPVHIAAACETPVVSIFTRNQPGINPERWQPVGERCRYVAVTPTQDHNFQKAGSADPKYLELISVQQVLEAVDEIFKLC